MYCTSRKSWENKIWVNFLISSLPENKNLAPTQNVDVYVIDNPKILYQDPFANELKLFAATPLVNFALASKVDISEI